MASKSSYVPPKDDPILRAIQSTTSRRKANYAWLSAYEKPIIEQLKNGDASMSSIAKAIHDHAPEGSSRIRIYREIQNFARQAGLSQSRGRTPSKPVSKSDQTSANRNDKNDDISGAAVVENVGNRVDTPAQNVERAEKTGIEVITQSSTKNMTLAERERTRRAAEESHG